VLQYKTQGVSMKKSFLVLVVFVSFLLGNCVGNSSLKGIQFDILESSPTGIQFDTLETKVFTLNRITYSTNIHHISFASLPINDIVKFVEAQYGINIDMALFADAEMNESNMSSWVACSFINEYDDRYSTSLRYESSENQLVGIDFRNYYPQNELQADISIYVKGNGEGSYLFQLGEIGEIIGQTEMSIKVSN
jgi:hypothetical protein